MVVICKYRSVRCSSRVHSYYFLRSINKFVSSRLDWWGYGVVFLFLAATENSASVSASATAVATVYHCKYCCFSRAVEQSITIHRRLSCCSDYCCCCCCYCFSSSSSWTPVSCFYCYCYYPRFTNAAITIVLLLMTRSDHCVGFRSGCLVICI